MKPIGDQILETVPQSLLFRAIEVHGQIFPVIGAVGCLHIVENTWVARVLKKPIHHDKITDTHDSKTARLRFAFFTSSQA
jgi:hypothetical protein